MKVALVSTPTRTSVPNIVPPLGLMYLGSYLRDNGHTVKLFDVARTRQSNEKTLDELNNFQPDLIAISGIITAYKFIRTLVHDIKKMYPNIPIVVGGHISLDNVELLLKNVGCNFTINGYGEKKIVGLVEVLEGKREIGSVPGLSYFRDGEIQTNSGTLFFKNMNEIPLPAYDLIDMEYYATIAGNDPALTQYLAKTGKPAPKLRSFCVIGARGCTDRCTFCVHEFDFKGFHVHSINYVIANIRTLYEDYGIRIFGFGEDLFLYKLEQVKELVDAMNTHFPDAFFSCSTRADFINRELLSTLEQSNCYSLLYGFESGDPFILRVLGKHLTPKINIRAFKLISETNITPLCSFMVGTPGETYNSIKNTITAINQAGIFEGGIFFTTPYPGSRLFRWCREQGKIVDMEAFLVMISDRDASVMSFNFTPYPDIIVKMMYVMLQNSFETNKQSRFTQSKTSVRERVIKKVAVPVFYRIYFILRKMLSIILPKYRLDRIPFELNARGTVKISTDQK